MCRLSDDHAAIPAIKPASTTTTTMKPSTEDEGTTTYNYDVCTPVHDIIFVKTHKTASSTLQNILFRYGTKHQLTFAMPANNGNRFSYPGVFKANMVKAISKPINIIANHLRASPDLKKGTYRLSNLHDPDCP